MSNKNQTQRAERAERAAALVAEQRSREQRRARLNIAAVVAVILVIVVGGFLINRTRDSTADVTTQAAGSGGYGVTVGQQSAPNEVVIYEDFLCPYCGQLEAASHDQLAQLAADGEVLLEYRPVAILGDDYSVPAANAFKVVLDAAGPEVAKKFHDLLYENQPEEGADSYPGSDFFVEQAVAAGASETDVRQGIEDESQQSWVEDATKKFHDDGLQGTPTILLNGKVFQDGRTRADQAANLVDQLSSGPSSP